LEESLRVAEHRSTIEWQATHSGVVWTMLRGRPMTCYQQLGEFTSFNGWGPSKGWSQTTGWRVAAGIAAIVIDSTAQRLAEAPFLGFSLDESTDTAGAASSPHPLRIPPLIPTIETAIELAGAGHSRMSIHVYFVDNWQRCSALIAFPKLEERPSAEYIIDVLRKQLLERTKLPPSELSRKIVLGAADGARTLQGSVSGVLLRARETFAPWALQLHCMAHRIDLCAEAIEQHDIASAVVGLLKSSYLLCARSPNRSQLLTANQAALDLPKHVMLRDVETRWISHYGPLERVMKHIPALMLTAADIQDGKAGKSTTAASDLLERITNFSILVAAAALRPMFLQLQLIIKELQSDNAYIIDLMDSVVATTDRIHSMYDSLTGFSGHEFMRFLQLTTPSHEQCPLVQDSDGLVAYRCKLANGTDHDFSLYTVLPGEGRKGRTPRPVQFSMQQVVLVREAVKEKVAACAMSVVAQLRERMGDTPMFRSLGIVFPQIFNSFDEEQFDSLVTTFCSHFGVSKQGHSALIDADKLRDQQDEYIRYGKARVQFLSGDSKPDVPLVVQFWRSMSSFEVIPQKCSEWIKVAKIALTMVSGSVADERAFSAMNFIKNDLRNRLDTNLEACLLTYMQDMFTTATFPYAKLSEMMGSV
jgi:hypothetical protein